MLNQPDKPHRQRLSVHFLHQMLYNYPLAFWGGLWASVVVIGAIAALGLVSTGPIKEEEPVLVDPVPAQTTVPESSTPLPSLSPTEDSQTALPGFTAVPEPEVEAPKKEKVPSWLYAAIAFGFCGGSLLIALNVNRTSRRKSLKRPRAGTKPVSTSSVGKKRIAKSKTATLARPMQRRPMLQNQPSVDGIQVAPIPRTASARSEVTVVPAEENHPLDWGEESLAEVMDLRKRQPLAALLKK
jgi:hypothetical protein